QAIMPKVRHPSNRPGSPVSSSTADGRFFVGASRTFPFAQAIAATAAPTFRSLHQGHTQAYSSTCEHRPRIKAHFRSEPPESRVPFAHTGGVTYMSLLAIGLRDAAVKSTSE